MNAKQRFIKQCKEKFYECYKELDGKDVVLFAAGGRAHMMVLAFKEMGIKANIRAILDNHCKEERYIEKIPVYNAKRIGDFSDSIFIVCSDTYDRASASKLKLAEVHCLIFQIGKEWWNRCSHCMNIKRR